MHFIQLTLRYSGDVVFINADSIVSMMQRPGVTWITFEKHQTFEVAQTLSEILEML